MVQKFAADGYPDVSRLISAANLIALYKGGTRIGPIAIGVFMKRLITNFFMLGSISDSKAHLVPLQVSCGVKWGHKRHLTRRRRLFLQYRRRLEVHLRLRQRVQRLKRDVPGRASAAESRTLAISHSIRQRLLRKMPTVLCASEISEYAARKEHSRAIVLVPLYLSWPSIQPYN